MIESVKRAFEKSMAQAKEAFESFPWEDPKAYSLWLKQTHYFVENSTRLIALAGSRFPLELNHLHRRFLKHCSEEVGHEVLPIRDVNSLGLDFAALKVFPETKALYQSQYYWIERVNPISFFGYILFLEGLAVHRGKEVFSRVNKAHGPNKHSFLKVHSEEDEDHLEKAFDAVKNISDLEAKLICDNLEMTGYFYISFLKQISLETQKPKDLKKAS